MSSRHVWSGHEADVEIYHEDDDGNLLSGYGVILCYWEDFEINGNLPTNRLPCTGRRVKRITREAYEFSATVNQMYFSKEVQNNLDDIFNREQWLRVVIRCVDADEQDVHTLSRCLASDFKINGKENDLVFSQSSFVAELYE